MPLIRAVVTIPVSSFGRRSRTVSTMRLDRATRAFGDDARLFALTFAGGFLFTSVYLA